MGGASAGVREGIGFGHRKMVPAPMARIAIAAQMAASTAAGLTALCRPEGRDGAASETGAACGGPLPVCWRAAIGSGSGAVRRSTMRVASDFGS